jgi:hypothetical protein
VKRLLVLGILLVAPALGGSRAADTLHPDQLRRGMKGHGLSVFQGTTPERFEVEILGVLKNTFPKQDMILIRMSGADLEKHKVIAGMSGSPIYINDKLIGALAYGWPFENEPLAGVTPAHNMFAELERARRQPAARRGGTAPTASARAWFDPPTPFAGLGAAPTAGDGLFSGPRPLLTPLSLSGFSPQVTEMIAPEFQSRGLWPVAVGGVSGGANGRDNPPNLQLEPGSALGVQLIRGDLNAVAVGTVTHVQDNKVLAFGHPFFHGGPVEAPAVAAEVHAIMSSLARSFKLASGVTEVGAVVGDWRSCIVADTARRAAMIPVGVDVANRDTGHRERYAMEVMNNPAFTPLLVLVSVVQAVFSTSGSSQDTTLEFAVNVTLPGREVRVTDTLFNPTGGLLNLRALLPLLRVFNTPFGNPEVQRVEVAVSAALERRTADIKRAYFSKAELQRGERAPLNVVLKPFDHPEIIRSIPIQVPTVTDSMRELTIVVMGGTQAPADVARPDSLDDYLDAIQLEHRSTDLVAIVQTPTQGMQYRGRLLKKLPLSVLNVLEDNTASDILTAADVLQVVEPTDWVLSGFTIVRVPIKQD